MLLFKKKILITRPRQRAQALSEKLLGLGAIPAVLPTIEIQPVALGKVQQDLLEKLTSFWGVICISKAAVSFAFDFIALNTLVVKTPHWFAIGPGTQQALVKKGILEVACAEVAPFNSEALLQLPLLQAVSGKKILIFKGVGGRGYLSRTLIKRGALVDSIDFYKRVLPTSEQAGISVLLQDAIDCIVATSQTGIAHLLKMIPIFLKSKLLDIPIVIIGKRQANFAKQQGFEKVLISPEAEDNAILETMQAYFQKAIQ